MKVFKTHLLDPKSVKPTEREWVYNGLDACITAEVLEMLLPQLDDTTMATYRFSSALQGPVLGMRLKGILVDQRRRGEVIAEYRARLNTLEHSLSRIVGEGLGFWDFNHRSHSQLKELLYGTLGLPPVRSKGHVSVDRDALEKLEAYLIARPIISHIVTMRELEKKISVLNTEIDSDSRYRTSYNIGGTSTGRFSSSLSEFGTGGNLQNIEELLRSIFVADPGMKMGYFDAEQGESRVVGAIEHNIFGDDRYLDACEGGDLHTTVARMVWPDMDWSGDIKLDKALAEEPYYRHYSRRFMCKKLGHGSNYGGQPRTLSDQTKVELELVEDFQHEYFKAFPAHKLWHEWVEDQIRSTGKLISLMGRRRHFLGRRDDPKTIREAIAYDPQGSLVDIVNRGMLAVWRSGVCDLLMQNHDAIVVQFHEQHEDDVVPKILELLRTPVELNGEREFIIPYGVKTGWNFGLYGEDNVDGLKEYKAGKGRKRLTKPSLSILDRPVYGYYKRA